MICPTCGTVNRDDARTCKECGIRLTGRNMRPADAAKEKKYLRVGALTAGVVLLLAILLFSAMCKACNCGGCNCGSNGGGENAINDNVEGDWSAIESVSGADAGEIAPVDEPVLEGTSEEPIE